MRTFVKTLALIYLSASSAAGASVLFQGTFATDEQFELFSFTLSATSAVTLQSYGYAGGTFGPTTVAAGGFAPYASVFALVGSDYVLAASDNGGHCPPAQVDPVSGNCDDPLIQTTLSAGTYFLGLSVWDNAPLTGVLADGYAQAGNPGFTCVEGGVSGQFCDVTDALFRSRTGDWAFAFTGVDTATDVTAPVPEPSSWLSLSGGGLLIALLRRRRLT